MINVHSISRFQKLIKTVTLEVWWTTCTYFGKILGENML